MCAIVPEWGDVPQDPEKQAGVAYRFPPVIFGVGDFTQLEHGSHVNQIIEKLEPGLPGKNNKDIK